MPRSSNAPPRFLIGVALIFWGYMTDRPVLGVSLALVIEAAHWTKLRWDFEEQAFLRAWQLSALLIAATMVLILVDGGRYVAVPRLLGWLPLLLVPVQFTQSYGLKDRMPLTTFSFFARRRMLRNLELGLPIQPIEVNFSGIYVATIIVGSALGDQSDSWWFLVGLVGLTGWGALSAGRRMWLSLLVPLVFAGAFAIGGQMGLRALTTYLTKSNYGDAEENTMSHYRTAIGSRGEVKQSTEILWRMKTLQGSTPRLLHTAIFNHYDKASWSYRIPPELKGTNTDFNSLRSLDSPGGQAYSLTNPDSGSEAIDQSLPRISLRGAAKLNSAIPVPGGITALTGFDLDDVERNAIGTVRVFPKSTVIEGVMVWMPETSPENAPWSDTWAGKPYIPDLRVPSDESEAVKTIVRELDLKAMPLEKKLQTLRQWFASNFRYTRYLKYDANKLASNAVISPLSYFLTKERAGHCEYFATATTMILREAGVPTRYAIGFAAIEYNHGREETVIRGTHGHAWCRVWDEEKRVWIDYDTTPGSWVVEETQRTPWYQGFLDWVQRQREDFFLWRNRPGNGLLIGASMSVIGLIGAFIIGRNLWRSRRRIGDLQATYRWDGPTIRTPLHELEPVAAKLLGPRPTGVPLGTWLNGLPPVEGLDEAVELHQRLRFDPDQASSSGESRLADLSVKLRNAILELVRKRPRKQP